MTATKETKPKATEAPEEEPQEEPKEQYAPEPYDEEILIRTRTAQKPGTTVDFFKCGEHMYAVQCEHGTRKEANRRYEVARMQSHPEDWCDECKAQMELREKEKAEKKAEKKARREKAKAEEDDKPKPKKAPPKKATPKPAASKAKPKKVEEEPETETPEFEGDPDPQVDGWIMGQIVHNGEKKASLAAATRAVKKGVRWPELEGTGKDGTVVVADVEGALT